MLAPLNLTPQDVDTPEKRLNYNVTVVGCGQRGIFFTNMFAEAGFKVTCIDADPSVTKKVSRGKTPNSTVEAEMALKRYITKGQVSVSGDAKKAFAQSDITVIAVEARVDEQKKPDYSTVSNAAKQVGETLQRGALVVYGGVAGFGFIDGTLKETLENTSGLKLGQDFGLAYIPVVTVPHLTDDLELKVAASDPTSLAAAVTILSTVAKTVKQVVDVKTAELATLFSIAKQDVDRALANELAVFCENVKMDYFEVLNMLDVESSIFYPAVLEDANRSSDACLLLDSAENLNVKLKLQVLARQINEGMVKYAVNLTQDALRDCGKTLRRARIALIGEPNHGTFDVFVRLLEQKGAKVSVYKQAKREAADSMVVKNTLTEAVDAADCLIFLSAQMESDRLNFRKLKALMKLPAVVVDFTGKLEPQKVRAEGFIYCGLGRGTDRR
ncbi:MAG: hypothetical protein NWE98_05565 [Candidatus Bathyarchaeota archaeon]|nr:hypothetical protein [Candidatus Bathyarchaeota archaeon]